MDNKYKWAVVAWKWIIQPVVHTTWAHLLFWFLILSLPTSFAAFIMGERSQGKLEQELTNQLISRLADMCKHPLTPVKDVSEQFDLSGTWDYKAFDTVHEITNSGDVRIVHSADKKFGFVDGHRKETRNSSGYVTKLDPPMDWKSLWGQITPEECVRAEYMIKIDGYKNYLGYLILYPPSPPFNRLNGFYYMLAPKLITGDISFKKQ